MSEADKEPVRGFRRFHGPVGRKDTCLKMWNRNHFFLWGESGASIQKTKRGGRGGEEKNNSIQFGEEKGKKGRQDPRKKKISQVMCHGNLRTSMGCKRKTGSTMELNQKHKNHNRGGDEVMDYKRGLKETY